MKAQIRTVLVDIQEILDLVNCSDTYGFADQVLLSTLAEFTRIVTDEEIEQYADNVVNIDDGLSDRSLDKSEIVKKLRSWRNKYCKPQTLLRRISIMLHKIEDTWRCDNSDATSTPYIDLNREFDEILSLVDDKLDNRK